MKRYLFATALAFLVVVLPGRDAIRASGSSYTVEDLGDIDGLVPTVTGMNASGQVSGYVNADTGPRAVRFTNGIGWEYVPGVSTYSVAMAINASGDVAGYHLVPEGVLAFRYTNGVGATTIPPLPGGSFGVGFGINASGEVTGYGDMAAGTRGWRAAPGLPPVMVPALGGDSMTCGINDAGQIVGSATTATGQTHAYRVDADNLGVTEIVPFDGPSGFGNACAIDAAGRVGGNTTSGGLNRAFRFTSGAPINLDTFASSTDSNVSAMANGVSVGAFVAGGVSHAFVHTDVNGSLDLNDLLAPGSGWVLEAATAVNTEGQIAGNGLLNGAARAYRLTPGQSDTTAPVISEVSATPSRVWPPNGALVPVTVSVTATDDSGAAPACSLTSLTASGPTTDGSGITGPLSAQVRAVGGVTYTLTVTCTDAVGNSSSAATTVVVPPDTTAPVITNVHATPDAIWPPNGKMVPVTVSFSATDDVDSAPKCYLASVSGGGSNDAVKTGRFTANVRSEKNADGSVRVYSLTVKCSDSAGNKSAGVATVVVGKDSAALKAFLRAQVAKLTQELKKLQRSRGSSR